MISITSGPVAPARYPGLVFGRLVRYRDGDVCIPATAIDETFMAHLEEAVHSIGCDLTLVAAPSNPTCIRCHVPSANYPYKINPQAEEETR